MSENIKELRQRFDCGKCQQCEFRECELAIALSLERLIFTRAEEATKKRADDEELKRSCRAMLPKEMADKLDFDDLERVGAVWGRG